jgi:DNA primase
MASLRKPILHDEAHRYALRLVRRLADDNPRRYALSAQRNRRGRIFLDYLRNGRGTTAIGTYSPRVCEDLPIAVPVTWSRIEAGIRSDAFTINSPLRARSDTASRSVRKSLTCARACAIGRSDNKAPRNSIWRSASPLVKTASTVSPKSRLTKLEIEKFNAAVKGH